MEPSSPPPCANCAAPAKEICARCKAAPYCGAPCQKAHWRAHKPLCVTPEAGGTPLPPPPPPPTPSAPASKPPPVVNPHCSHCAKALRPGKGVCNSCKSVAFCGAECQRAAWQVHKPLCLARA